MEMFRQRYILHFLLPSTRRRLLADSFNLYPCAAQRRTFAGQCDKRYHQRDPLSFHPSYSHMRHLPLLIITMKRDPSSHPRPPLCIRPFSLISPSPSHTLRSFPQRRDDGGGEDLSLAHTLPLFIRPLPSFLSPSPQAASPPVQTFFSPTPPRDSLWGLLLLRPLSLAFYPPVSSSPPSSRVRISSPTSPFFTCGPQV